MAGIGTIAPPSLAPPSLAPLVSSVRFEHRLNEQVRAASFAKALLLIRQKSRRRVGKIGDGFSQCDNASPSIKPNECQTLATNVRYRGGPDSSGAARNRRD